MSAPANTAASRRDLSELVSAVFERWRAERITFLVLRNYEGLPQTTTNDVDVLVSPAQLASSERILVETACAAGFQLHNRAEFSPVSLFFHHPASLTQIQIDLFHSLEWRSLTLLPTQVVLDGRIDRGQFAIPHPVHEAVICLLTRQIYHGYVKDAYKAQIQAAAQSDPEEMRGVLERMFGRGVAAALQAGILDGNWAAVETQTGAMRRQLIWRRAIGNPLVALGSVVRDLKRLAGRFWNPPGITIVLLGADGCGKSTVAAELAQALRYTFNPDKSLRVHWKPAVFLRRRRVERPPTTDPHGQSPRGRLASLAALFYHWLEYLAGAVFQFHRVLFRNGLVLIDRYHYDFEVDARRYRLQVSGGLIRALFGRLPSPDLVFLLDAPAEVLRTRKQEVPLAETQRQREAYRALAVRLPNAKIIDVNQPVEAVASTITKHILEYLEARLARRRRP